MILVFAFGMFSFRWASVLLFFFWWIIQRKTRDRVVFSDTSVKLPFNINMSSEHEYMHISSHGYLLYTWHSTQQLSISFSNFSAHETNVCVLRMIIVMRNVDVATIVPIFMLNALYNSPPAAPQPVVSQWQMTSTWITNERKKQNLIYTPTCHSHTSKRCT